MADSSKSEETCPVDHKAREAWLQHARAANPDGANPSPHPPHPIPHPPAEADQQQSQSWTQSLLSYTPFSSTPAASTSSPANADACPVDHKSREAWLQQARAANASANPHPHPHPPADTPNPHAAAAAAAPPQQSSSGSWSQTIRSYIPFASSSSPTQSTAAAATPQPAATRSPLDTHREVSTIPRTVNAAAYPGNPATTHAPSNHEQETGADATTGNWVYPSEKMFFDAMKRKGHDTRAADMATVVPIHNAVNERAWKEIKEWERPYTEGTTCGGPKLHSFAGLSTNMSPKARINTLLGYTPPFDRHDWVIDRCGVQVDYIIDFYAGRPDAHGKPSFYLDVRPKLNSWEGVKMRALRGVGLA
ncbi:cytochrome c/c1 heme lyase [Colletotrichum truncatum]|uniref:Cytochrome c/c1 heme lyase n=1 Tax=Colletotrichum truncatum TaxID=5467 RepID=A0ACC3YTK6_COLTU|nr:cytochrome c/c1 heme lyase [Colletotrichum truncatum]KAF6799205.1 cytochrome c/c1 heme lyase [Colletotrichum truncatum]